MGKLSDSESAICLMIPGLNLFEMDTGCREEHRWGLILLPSDYERWIREGREDILCYVEQSVYGLHSAIIWKDNQTGEYVDYCPFLRLRESRPSVVGTVTDAKTAKTLQEHGVALLDSGMIVGMNGLLVGLAGAQGLQGFCLLGATAGGLLDVRATEEVLKALTKVLGFKLDLTDLQTYSSIVSKLKPPKLKLPKTIEEEVSYIR